jgi:glucose-6-phosphate isomerase
MITLNLSNSQTDLEDLSKYFDLLDNIPTKDFTDWLQLPDDPDNVIKPIQQFTANHGDDFDHIIACGIGGSSLGIITIHKALFPFQHKLFVADNLDSVTISHILNEVDPERTLFLIISKSGGTLETMTQYLLFKQFLGKHYPKNMIAITDPKEGHLREMAEKDQIKTFPIPSKVGGRFSVLTALGLLPLTMLGGDPEELLKGAAEMRDRCTKKSDDNPALQLALATYQLNKPILAMMSYSDQLYPLTLWYQQLLAESIGKSSKIGITPLPLRGSTDQHSVLQLLQEGPNNKLTIFLDLVEPTKDVKLHDITDKQFGYINDKTIHRILRTELEGTACALSKAGRPNAAITVPEVNEYNLGQLFFLFQMQIAILGELYGVEAYNQPGVEKSKTLTKELLQKSL